MRGVFIFTLPMLVMSCATNSFSEIISINLTGDNKLVLHNNGNGPLSSLQVDFKVDGYTVNCNRSRIIIWGRENNQNDFQVPDGYYSAYSLNSLKRIGEQHSAGVYDVIFIDSYRAYISAQSGAVLDTRTGKVSLPEQSDNDFIYENDAEECNRPILHYNRYPQD